MWKRKHPTVLVAGAGPIGMTAAISLLRQGKTPLFGESSQILPHGG